MRDCVFLQGCVTVVAIVFRSVLTAPALFHVNDDPMHVLMLKSPPPPPPPGRPWGFDCFAFSVKSPPSARGTVGHAIDLMPEKRAGS